MPSDIDRKGNCQSPTDKSVLLSERFFDSFSEAVLIFNNKGTIVQANRAAHVLYGYRPDELKGLSGKDIVKPDYYHSFRQAILKAKNGEDFSAESVNIKKNEDCFYSVITGAAIVLEEEVCFLAIVRNLSLYMEKNDTTANHPTEFREQLQKQPKDIEQAKGRSKQPAAFLTICCYCKKIRDEEGFWQQVDSNILKHFNFRLTHGACEECCTKEMKRIANEYF